MAFAGASLIAQGKLCALTASPIDARADRGYHLLVVEGYGRSNGTPPNGEFIKSRPFLVGGHRFVIWYYPNGFEEEDEEFISVFLMLDDYVEAKEVKARAVFSFIDEPELRMSARMRKNEIPSDSCWPERELVRKDILERSRHLKNGTFIIRCDIDVHKTAADASTADSLVHMPPSDLQIHLRDLLISKDGADITFEVRGETFAAHRYMLAARSTVFKEQLFDGTTMKERKVIEVNDMDPKIFNELLAYIYTDSFLDGIEDYKNPASGEDEEKEETKSGEDKTDSTAMWLLQLIEAADRYDLQRLKLICEEKLAEYICMDNVADIIVVAERRRCLWLRDACSEFMKSYTSLYTVFTADSLDQIIRTCSPSVLKELLSKFSA